jgi:hypothetical protein
VPADPPKLPTPVETTAGRCVLRLGDPAGARIVGELRRGDTRSLAQAIAQERAERRIPAKRARRNRASAPGATAKATPEDMAETETIALEHGGEHADEVTDKVTQAIELVGEFAAGRIDVGKLVPLADELGRLLGRLDREGRHQEAVRVARCLAVLLSLLARWPELLDSLQTVVKIAERIEDRGAKAWALHEQGTLRLAGEDYAAADSLLAAARAMRQDAGDTHAANVTAGNMQALCGALRARLHEPPSQRLVRILNKPVPTFVLGALLLIGGGAAGALIRGPGEK